MTDPNDVCNEFAKHFEQIAKIPNDAPDDPDIVKRVSDTRGQCCDGEIRHIETDELSKLWKGCQIIKRVELMALHMNI